MQNLENMGVSAGATESRVPFWNWDVPRGQASPGSGCQRSDIILRISYLIIGYPIYHTPSMINRAAADRVVIWGSGFLPTTARGADSSCQIMLVERLAYERLDHRLAAD